MKFCHSFWSKPLFEKKFGSFNECLINTLLDYAYSAACIHKLGHQIVLYADCRGAELLSFIPYDEVILIDVLDNTSIHFAASVKFEALKHMSPDDVLIDGDIFIEDDKICKLIKESNVDFLYSFNEENETVLLKSKYEYLCEYYTKLLSKINVGGILFSLPSLSELRFPNTSLIKITNKELKNRYIEQYEYHKSILGDVDFENTWPDIIIEQYFLWNFQSEFLIQSLITPEVDNTGFTHLGNCKSRMRDKVRQKLYFLDKEKVKDVMKRYRELEV